jgi:hypothetical protein
MSGEVRYAPRKLSLDALIAALVEEHGVMRAGLRRSREAMSRNDYQAVKDELQKVDPIFRQHIADEESRVLRFLIQALGVKGAENEIKVFQQHRPIYDLMTRVGELAAMPSGELQKSQDELQALSELHTEVEETEVFPKTAALNGQAMA